MATKLIRLKDDILVEVEAPDGGYQQVSGGAADKVLKSIDQIGPVLLGVSSRLADIWQRISQDLEMEEAEIDLGLGFEGEGNVYIAKAKGSANLTLKLKLKKRSQKDGSSNDTEHAV